LVNGGRLLIGKFLRANCQSIDFYVEIRPICDRSTAI
jgi:hypothetical protein